MQATVLPLLGQKELFYFVICYWWCVMGILPCKKMGRGWKKVEKHWFRGANLPLNDPFYVVPHLSTGGSLYPANASGSAILKPQERGLPRQGDKEIRVTSPLQLFWSTAAPLQWNMLAAGWAAGPQVLIQPVGVLGIKRLIRGERSNDAAVVVRHRCVACQQPFKKAQIRTVKCSISAK